MIIMVIKILEKKTLCPGNFMFSARPLIIKGTLNKSVSVRLEGQVNDRMDFFNGDA